MKFIKTSVIVALIVTMAAMFAFATTSANNTVTKVEPWGSIVYSSSISLTLLTTGDVYYTQAMLIGLVDKDRYGRIIASCTEVGTEDVNIFLEYSSDKTTWTAGTTDTDLDAVGTTVVKDTIGIVQATACDLYKTHCYVRGKIVPGQTITTGSILSLKFIFPKLAAHAKSRSGSIEDYN